MTAKWVSCTLLIACLALATGCRTPTPNLKPEKTPEKLVEPPQGVARYEQTGYPKQAFDPPEDPSRLAIDAKGMAMPRAGAGGAAMGGMSGR